MLTYNPSLWEYGVKDAIVRAGDLAKEEVSLVGPIASYETSGSYHNLYPWIGEAPVMQLLRAELEIAGMSDATVEVLNDTYKIGIEVPRNQIHDDQLGATMRRVSQMGAIALNFKNKLIAAAIEAGTTYGSFDGVSLFNDTHPIRGAQTATQDNLLAGTGTSVTALKTDLAAAIAVAQGWKAENGEPFAGSRTNWTVLVPPGLLIAMLEAINAPIVPIVFGSNTAAASVGNVGFASAGMSISVISSPRLTDANDWYLFDAGSVKPLIYQEADPVTIEMLLSGSDNWVKRDKALFTARWRGGVGYNHPGLSFKTVNS